MKKAVTWMLALTMALTLAGCGSNADETAADQTEGTSAETSGDEASADDAETIKIGVAQSDASDEMRVTWDNYFVEAAEAKGYEVVITDASLDVSKQISDVESLVTQGCDIILCVPREGEGIVSALQSCKDAGIPVVLMGVDVPEGNADLRTAFINTSNYDMGVLQAEYTQKWLEERQEELKLGYVVGLYSLPEYMKRQTGYYEALGITEAVVEGEGEYQAEGGMKLAEDWLQVYDLNVYACQNDNMAIGVSQALRAANVNMDDVLILGMDGLEHTATYIRDGSIDATVATDFQEEALFALDLAEKILAGEEVEEVVYPDSLFMMDASNVDEYFPE